MEIKEKKKKPINYGTDVHARLKNETFEDLKKISEYKKIPYSALLRKYVEDGIKRDLVLNKHNYML